MFIKMFGKLLLRRPLTSIWKQNIKRVIFFYRCSQDIDARIIFGFFSKSTRTMCEVIIFFFINFVQRFSTSKILHFLISWSFPFAYAAFRLPSCSMKCSPCGPYHGLRHSRNYSAVCMRISCQKICEAPLPQ